jgi:hypothetical protein
MCITTNRVCADPDLAPNTGSIPVLVLYRCNKINPDPDPRYAYLVRVPVLYRHTKMNLELNQVQIPEPYKSITKNPDPDPSYAYVVRVPVPYRRIKMILGLNQVQLPVPVPYKCIMKNPDPHHVYADPRLLVPVLTIFLKNRLLNEPILFIVNYDLFYKPNIACNHFIYIGMSDEKQLPHYNSPRVDDML